MTIAAEAKTKPLTVYMTGEIDDARMAELRQRAPNATLRYFPSDIALEAEIADADVVAGHISPQGLNKAKSLKWVHSWAAGPNAQLFPEFVKSDVVLTCSKGNGAIPLAEHAMMLMLMLNRNAMRWIQGHRDRKWDPFFHGELNGLTVGIIGTGYSGSDLALKCKAFHMRVLGLRRNPQPTPNFDAMYTRDQLHGMLSECDFVVVTAPKTPETANLLGEAEFRAMKPSAFYVCFSRGGIADDKVLYRAIDEEWIAGAGLDAHGVEPLPADSPFWTLKNTIITPHNGATTLKTKARGYEIFRDNLERYVEGRKLINIANKQLGY
ncbi:D-2-hydroxyacid dehydrogenase [Devosia nitrariae]|uniref:2-hydroxyacid dehydrogenase n=1 Tax=Devosia nitrariae TaxID=2071872 RepID=A0ABQ5W5G7_9HYPH|nr:D-2-hydroxyacid dehydrogenase [Devosia nitrariae]GLQ55176.1 2-hydroxyacid dehydrogenase [Devosia nitrariae]